MIFNSPSPRQLGEEALAALRAAPRETPEQVFARLVRMGLTDTQGRVTRLYGGEAEPETDKANQFLEPNGRNGG